MGTEREANRCQRKRSYSERIAAKAADSFVGDAEQFDDMTMLCLEYKGMKNT